MLFIYIIDNIISLIAILKIRKTTSIVSKENLGDNTEEITKKVRELLMPKSYVNRRLLNAYPKLEAIRVKVKEKIEKTKDEIEKKKEVLDEKVTITKETINKKIKKIEKKKE